MAEGQTTGALASRAMRVSVATGVVMMLGKVIAYLLTGSPAILSDAAESVIHLVAVGFATWSLRLSFRPADDRFRYGYERVTFFSAGFEGALIVIAALVIIYTSIEKWLAGLTITHLGKGTAITFAASMVSLGLGLWLVRTGKRENSLIVEAHGRHVLTDSWTSFGVVAGLLLVLLTGWKPFDPLVAIAVALNLIWSGGGLMWKSLVGLMDRSDPDTAAVIQSHLETMCPDLGIEFHEVRFRNTGSRLIIDLHLLFPYRMALGHAHALATMVEKRLTEEMGAGTEVITHLESREDHEAVHEAAPSSLINAPKPD